MYTNILNPLHAKTSRLIEKIFRTNLKKVSKIIVKYTNVWNIEKENSNTFVILSPI